MSPKTHGRHVKFWADMAKEVKKQDVKAIIWAGDAAVNRQDQLQRTFKMARQALGNDIPILFVRGNHDLWDDLAGKEKYYNRKKPKRTLQGIYDLHAQFFKESNITCLSDIESYVIEDVIFLGFDGWYANANPPTNDEAHMPRDVEGAPIHAYLSNKAWKEFERCLYTDTSAYRKSVLVTHHNPYNSRKGYESLEKFIYGNTCNVFGGENLFNAEYKFLDEITKAFDVLCCGHSHVAKDTSFERVRILNCGSDYDAPKFIVFEV
jgi:predicted phosphodiesterase